MREIWLIRHAETEWSKAHKHTGRSDLPLTDVGRERARELRPIVAQHDFAHVFTSPLSRARETAELAGLGDRAQLHDGLLEWDYGDYEGIKTVEIRETVPDWYLWRDGVPNGESPEDVTRRIDALIAELLELEGDVALFAHGHSLRAFAARWIEEPLLAGGRLALSTGSISVVGFEREVRVIWRWNQTSGL